MPQVDGALSIPTGIAANQLLETNLLVQIEQSLHFEKVSELVENSQRRARRIFVFFRREKTNRSQILRLPRRFPIANAKDAPGGFLRARATQSSQKKAGDNLSPAFLPPELDEL